MENVNVSFFHFRIPDEEYGMLQSVKKQITEAIEKLREKKNELYEINDYSKREDLKRDIELTYEHIGWLKAQKEELKEKINRLKEYEMQVALNNQIEKENYKAHRIESGIDKASTVSGSRGVLGRIKTGKTARSKARGKSEEARKRERAVRDQELRNKMRGR